MAVKPQTKPEPRLSTAQPSEMRGKKNEREASYEERLVEARSSSYEAIKAWNAKFRALVRGVRRDAPLPEAAMKELNKPTANHPDLPYCVWLLQDFRNFSEKSRLPNGGTHNEKIQVPHAWNIMLDFPGEGITVDANGRGKAKPVMISLSLPSATCKGRHITKNYTPEDAFRAILKDPNWGKMYMIKPMTEDEVKRQMSLEYDDEVLETVQRRGEAREHANAINGDPTGALVAIEQEADLLSQPD